MEKIETRYKDMKTGKGHEIRVDLRKNELILWYLYWGEYQGVDDHHQEIDYSDETKLGIQQKT